MGKQGAVYARVSLSVIRSGVYVPLPTLCTVSITTRNPQTPNPNPIRYLHLFVAIAILRQHKEHMIKEEMEFDDVLKFVNSLALRIDCLQTLKDADWLSQLAIDR